MERNQRIRLYLAAALAVTTAAATSACTDAGASMLILQNQVPDEGCSIPPGPDADFRGRGRIDVQAGDGYLFTPVVESLIELAMIGQSSGVIAIRGADVDVTFPSGFFSGGEEDALRDDRLSRFSQAVSATLKPSGTVSFGFIIIPRGLLSRIGDKLGDGDEVQVTAEVVVFGDLGGSDVESVPFVYPVDVCNGCMKIDRGDCAALPDNFEALPGGECNALQDVPLDCCTSGGTEICPAAPPA